MKNIIKIMVISSSLLFVGFFVANGLAPDPGHNLSEVGADSDLDMGNQNIITTGLVQSTQVNSKSIEAIDTTGYFKFPVLNTVQRDTLPAETGMMIFNSDSGNIEVFDGTDWIS